MVCLLGGSSNFCSCSRRFRHFVLCGCSGASSTWWARTIVRHTSRNPSARRWLKFASETLVDQLPGGQGHGESGNWTPEASDRPFGGSTRLEGAGGAWALTCHVKLRGHPPAAVSRAAGSA